MKKVCVQGLGFVGSAMAISVAEARDACDRPMFEVVGIDIPSPQGLARVSAINEGRFPFATTDASLADAFKRAIGSGNLRASVDESEYESCDIAIVDVHLDVDFNCHPPKAALAGFETAVRTLGRRLPKGALVVVETTVPPGTTDRVVAPILDEESSRRGLGRSAILLAHSYERVMPGRDYLSSIKNFWRVYSGVSQTAADACENFLKCIINTDAFPLTRLRRPVESETAKLLENSFRAVNIALVDEWARFAEKAGIDLYSVIDAIRMRPTHQNLMRPGFGVGGYCLTKDPLLAGIGARDLFGLQDVRFPFCEAAIRVNDAMPSATVSMLRQMLGSLGGKRIILMGASYRQDVSDTRYSPSAAFVKEALTDGATVAVHDPLTDRFDTIDHAIQKDFPDSQSADAIVFAVPHSVYRERHTFRWIKSSSCAVLDANSVLPTIWIDELLYAGRIVRVIGRGDL